MKAVTVKAARQVVEGDRVMLDPEHGKGEGQWYYVAEVGMIGFEAAHDDKPERFVTRWMLDRYAWEVNIEADLPVVVIPR